MTVSAYLVIGVVGFAGFGWALSTAQAWIVPVVFFGLSSASVCFAATAAVSYVVDAHRNASDSALSALIFHKNIWSFGLTWGLVGQIERYGTQAVFGCVAILVAVTSLYETISYCHFLAPGFFAFC